MQDLPQTGGRAVPGSLTTSGEATDRSSAANDEHAAIEERLVTLDGVLATGLRRPPLTFDRLIVAPVIARFDPGPLAQRRSAPNWRDFAPAPPRGLARLLRGKARYRRRVAQARARFDAVQALDQQRAAKQRRAIAVAKAKFDRVQTQECARVAARNAYVAGRQAAVLAGEPDAVEWFTGCVLRASTYPDGFPREFRTAYRQENRDLVVELELPPPSIVPEAGGHQMVRQRYQRLICSVALRTLHEIFTATPAEVVAAVVINGRVRATDLGTGKPVRPHLLSVSVERTAFRDLILEGVDPAACLGRLDSVLSADPYQVQGTEPFVTLDRAVPARSADGLDARPNLQRITRADFEYLLRRLFLALGAQAWTVVAHAENGVDAVVISRPGESCLVRACRGRQPVELSAVLDTAEAMAAHRAVAATIVSTSWFTRAGERFARHNRITLVNGAELARLFREYLGADVAPGV